MSGRRETGSPYPLEEQAMKVLPVDMLGEDFSTTTTPSMCWRKVAR